MAKEWPPQDTGVFAVAFCVQCCNYVPPDRYEIASTKVTGYLMVGTPGFDGLAEVLYRTVVWSGGFSIRYSLQPDCSDTTSISVVMYSGSSTRNLSDFVTSTGTLIGVQDGTAFAETDASNPALAFPPALPSTVAATQTETTYVLTGTEQCEHSIYSSFNETASGTGLSELSNVCTEEVSLEYQSAQTPGWEEWSAVPMEPYYDYVTSATYTASPPGVEGYYTWNRMNFRRTKGGFTPGAEYVCTMEAYRAPAGTYDYVLYATMETTLTADAAGTLVWEGETPFARGYGTWVKARSFTATPA